MILLSKKSQNVTINMLNFDKTWVPTSICNSCRWNLNKWENIQTNIIIEPVMWREPQNHTTDCYFCACVIAGYNKRNIKTIVYPDVSSVTAAKKGRIENSHNSGISTSSELMDTTDNIHCAESEDSDVEDYENVSRDGDPQPYNQAHLDDLICDLSLPKSQAELLASRLSERNLLFTRN